jgi:hypothetical protein
MRRPPHGIAVSKGLAIICGLAMAAGVALAEAPDRGAVESGPGWTNANCFLGTLPDPGSPDDPRIALCRDAGGAACGKIVLDTGYHLSSVARPRDRKALARRRGPFSCVIVRKEEAPCDWEMAFVEMLSPGFRGEALLHMGRAREAIQAFFEGLPDPRSAAWLKQAAHNLPGPVAELLPDALRSGNLRRADSALDVLGVLVSAHPGEALESVRRSLDVRHRTLRPPALRLAGEEAAGLRAGRRDSPEAAAFGTTIENALSSRDPAVRAAAGEALLLSEPDAERRISLLARSVQDESDAPTREILLSALREAGGVEELFQFTRSDSPELRRDALWAASALPAWPEGESDPLIRLLREERADPGEVVKRLALRSGDIAEPWAAILRDILPSLKVADRARIPGLLCRLEGPSVSEVGLAILLDLLATETSREVAAAAVASLGSCGGEGREASLTALLSTARDNLRDEEVRTEAAESAADLANTPETYDRVFGVFRDALAGPDEAFRRVAIAGLLRLGHPDALRPATLLAGVALSLPPDPMSGASEEALRQMFDLAPGPVIAAIRNVGKSLPEKDQERALLLYSSLKPETWVHILERWRTSLSVPGARVSPAMQSEMQSQMEHGPTEILELIEPAFQASRGEERIRLLDLVVDLGRLLPDRVLSLLTLPEGSSQRLAEATREATAATLARTILAERGMAPAALLDMALDPTDSERRTTGRRSLWLLAWETAVLRRNYLVPWARAARRSATFPLRVELGRWLAQVSEMNPKRTPVTREELQEPQKARFLPDTSGDSAPAPSGPPGRDEETESAPPGGED